MKTKKIMIVILLVVVVLVGFLVTKNTANKKNPDETAASSEVSESLNNEIENSDNNKSTDSNNTGTSSESEKKEDSTKHEKNGTTEEKKVLEENGAGSTGSSSGSSTGNSSNSSVPVYNVVPIKPENAESQPQTISLPYTIPGSGIVVSSVSSFDGIYLEDGTDTPVNGVAALIVTNTGSTDVEYAEITLSTGDASMIFELSDLPSGATIVAQEKNQSGVISGTFNKCTGIIDDGKTFSTESNTVEINDNNDGTLTVRNISGQDIPCVRVFYKFYIPEEQVYVGGITYSSKLEDLKAGESLKISPTHYVAGGSKVVMVRTYESKE